MDILQLRVIERVLAVAIGGLSIFLGYRLFIRVPTQRDGSGKVSLPGGVNVMLSRVGPGVFFSLFGVWVVVTALRNGLLIDHDSTRGAPAPASGGVATVAATDGATDGASNDRTSREHTVIRYAVDTLPARDVAARRAEALGVMVDLDALLPLVRAHATVAQRPTMERAVREGKLAVAHLAWGRDLGDFDAFRNWVRDGRPQPRPSEVAESATRTFGAALAERE